MISKGRYGYHLEDVAEIRAMPEPLDQVQKMRLEMMEADMANFEKAYPAEAKMLQARAKEQVGS